MFLWTIVYIVMPPIAANDLLGINRFTEQQFIGNGEAIKTGKIGHDLWC